MWNLTLGTARSQIARVSNVCNDSATARVYLNEAQQRLLNRPDKPVGSFVRVRFCLGSDSCLSWPRAIRTIEAFAICDSPGIIRGQTFEFIGYPNGIGQQNAENMPGTMLIDRGTSVAFDDVNANTVAKKIQVVAQHASDVGKKITLRYYDSTGNKVFTQIDGIVQEGEQLTLAAPPSSVYTSNNVMTAGLYHVVKAVTNYPIRLYEVNASDLVQTKLLAYYEPSEEAPIYRRSFIPGLTNMPACHAENEVDCTQNKRITALVKLQHVPVVVDNDPLVIGNIAALKLMVMAILREEQNRHDESILLENKARAELDGELASYQGDGMVHALKVQDADLFGAGQPQTAIWSPMYG